jgi:hypothetical protein
LALTFTNLGFAEPPLIAILGTLLFAMPAVRNVQPGIPTIGCTVKLILTVGGCRRILLEHVYHRILYFRIDVQILLRQVS